MAVTEQKTQIELENRPQLEPNFPSVGNLRQLMFSCQALDVCVEKNQIRNCYKILPFLLLIQLTRPFHVDIIQFKHNNTGQSVGGGRIKCLTHVGNSLPSWRSARGALVLVYLRELHSFETRLLILRRLKGDPLLMSESEVREGLLQRGHLPSERS